MNKWTDLIENDPDFLSSLQTSLCIDEKYLWSRLMHSSNFYRLYNSRYRINYTDGMDNSLLQYDLNNNEVENAFKNVILGVSLSIFFELLNKNPLFANNLIEDGLKRKMEYLAEGAIRSYMEEKFDNIYQFEKTTEPCSVENDSYSFWWDYIENDAEIGIFSSHKNTPENGLIQIPYDTEEDRILAETEADQIVKEFYGNKRNLSDYIFEKSRESIAKNDLAQSGTGIGKLTKVGLL